MELQVQQGPICGSVVFPRAEWDLAMSLYSPAYQHPPGIHYCEEVLPTFPIWGPFFFSKIDLDLPVVLTGEQFCPAGKCLETLCFHHKRVLLASSG